MKKIVNRLANVGFFSFCLLATLFTAILEIAVDIRVPGTILTPLKLMFLLLCVSLLCVWIVKYKCSFKSFFGFIYENIKAVRFIFIALGIYILIDVINSIFAIDPKYAFTKYITVVQMLIVVVAAVYYVFHDHEKIRIKINHLCLVIGLVAPVAALWGFANYFFNFSGEVFIRRISPIADYNKYSTTILVCFAFLIVYILNSKWSSIRKWLSITVLSSMVVTAVYLSYSRRSFILLLIFCAAVLVYSIVAEILAKKAGAKTLQSILTILVCAVLTFMIFSVSSREFMKYSTIRYTKAVDEGVAKLPENPGNTVIETIKNGEALDKRSLIWSVAWREIRSFNIRELIFGKGGSYDSDLYDLKPDNTLNAEYQSNLRGRHWMNPHSIILSDILNGGLIRLFVSVILIGSMVVFVLRRLRRNLLFGSAVAFVVGVVVINAVISSSLGYINDKIFYIALIFIMGLYGLDRAQKESVKDI